MSTYWTADAERVCEDIDLMGEDDNGDLRVWEPCLFCFDGHWRKFTRWSLRHLRAYRRSRKANALVMLEVEASR